MLIVLATFVLCLIIVLGSYWALVVRPEERATSALRRRLTSRPAETVARTDLTRKEAPLSALKVLDNALAKSGRLADPVKRTLAISALPLSLGVIVLLCGFFGMATVAAVIVATNSPWTALLVGALAATLPWLYVRRRAASRVKAMEEQLPQAVDMIAVSLRAGHAFTTGLLMVGEELAAPLGTEFRNVYDQQNYGKPLPDVLREFAERVPLLDARIFVTAVLTQRETGGNLAEVLDKLSAVVRERFRVRRQVKALSAHGRVTGWVLALLPPVLAGILMLLAPRHISVLINDPVGRQLVIIAIALQLIGTFAIRRIVHVEF
jgi:tight adherence protein B